ncbi:MAG TPA: magnesium/cobalt transporter CorA [Ignavibacteriaceae bacterium]|nr:magnesium/cobalt transporter CorA [Ignavibacteriaceae bacterium]
MIRKSLSETKLGKSPGSLIFTGEKKLEELTITVYQYDSQHFEEKQIEDPSGLEAFKTGTHSTWIKVSGLHDINRIGKIGEIFNIHPLVLEDILNVNGIVKAEDYDEFLFMVAKRAEFKGLEEELLFEQLSFILTGKYLITFQEKELDFIDDIIDRLRSNKGRIRRQRLDYLMYRVLDTLVDNYSAILENFADQMDEIEDDFLRQAGGSPLELIHNLRKKIIALRRTILPLREAVNTIEKDRSPLFEKSTFVFFRDLLDHIKQNIESLDNFREAINGMLEINLSYANQKMNEIIKLLTIISTIFIPLTFIVGVYGMNFNPEAGFLNMPEINWKYGYITIMGIMLIIAGVLIYFFKKRKWF